MTMDVNDFDRDLKKKLHRDLIFRTLIWLSISLFTAFQAISIGGVTPIVYLQRVSNSLAPLINSIGTFSLLICLLALLLKDLEAVSTNERTQARTRAYPAGIIRRLAGDISLWSLGALIAMISALSMGCMATDLSVRDIAAAKSLFALLITLTLVTAIGNVLVRRSGPTPLVREIKNPTVLVTVYLFTIATVIAAVLKQHV